MCLCPSASGGSSDTGTRCRKELLGCVMLSGGQHLAPRLVMLSAAQHLAQRSILRSAASCAAQHLAQCSIFPADGIGSFAALRMPVAALCPSLRSALRSALPFAPLCPSLRRRRRKKLPGCVMLSGAQHLAPRLVMLSAAQHLAQRVVMLSEAKHLPADGIGSFAALRMPVAALRMPVAALRMPVAALRMPVAPLCPSLRSALRSGDASAQDARRRMAVVRPPCTSSSATDPALERAIVWRRGVVSNASPPQST